MMKTVSGVVLTSKPVSLSKAARILSKFAFGDNGASPAYVYYLKRASESFDELVQVHKEPRVSGSERKSKKHRSSIRDEDEEAVNSVRNYGEVEAKSNGVADRKEEVLEKKAGADGKRNELVLDDRRDEVQEPKKKKKKKTRDGSEGKDNGVERSTQGISDTIDTGAESKKKKKEVKRVKKDLSEYVRSNGVSNGEQVENYLKDEELGRKKNKKMNNGSEVENRDNKIVDLRDLQSEKEVSKKRKSEEIAADNGEVNDSAEKRMQNKKRKKEGKS